MAETKRANIWLVDTEEDLIGFVSTRPITLAEVADYLIEKTKFHILDIWESDKDELEFAGVEVLRI